jgi:arginine/serine-rich splicing factor 1/9
MSNSRLYVGNLPDDIKEREIDDVFYKFGEIESIDLKTPRDQKPYAFVQYRSSRDADEALHRRDRYMLFDRYELRVEFSRGRDKGRDRYDDRRGGGYGRDRYDDRRGGGRFGGRDGQRTRAPERTDYRCIVENMPEKASWQDLKDFLRPVAGFVGYANVRDGVGEAEFKSMRDLEAVIKELDGNEMSDRYGTTSIVKIVMDKVSEGLVGDKGRSRSRSPRRSRSRSPRRSRSRSRSPRGRSVSPGAGRSPSRSRSRSRDRSRREDSMPRNDDEAAAATTVNVEDPIDAEKEAPAAEE